MKKTLIILSIGTLLTACNKKTEQKTEAAKDSVAIGNTAGTEKSPGETQFDINSIPVSTAEVGELPFFSLPKGLEFQNKPVQRSYDMLFFPLKEVMTPIEGKVWKTYVVNEKSNTEEWSLPYFLKSYDDAITKVGGVKIFDGKVSQQELDRIQPEAKYFGEEGSIDYWNEPVKVYVIRRPNGDDIYIQLYGNTSTGAIQILQKAPFKQTISILKSDDIKKELDTKGKAVLHINFDTDKASLQPDGKKAVDEITKVLKSDNNLKLAINGYTDNSGNDAHNLQLSKDRATAVLNAIATSGIDKTRLSAEGFGSKNPMADNGSEEGKAQNRRVELVKK
ncbi:flagellar motor protein MotB [Chryseobacterium indologenes]|uniref:OmpA family protein n=1 Tax=Chryseobacterium indologenes TaxID=253 RepID=UPI000BFB66B2|nr:OmpA family protein [Chryseobacterium indologenes]ATN05842.1 flagellar motor protein MotB [Chryseobacterium indologenes]AYY85399.1 OmpA family protein [Chryseobacterium indologenes]QIX82296.1 OmpA family protein [Chryseobacterium indologenes]UDQ56088.1 OmpA family protein [Chryseobacterium indologenes]